VEKQIIENHNNGAKDAYGNAVRLEKESDYALASAHNTESYILCIAWLEDFFRSSGDFIPNRGGEIHIEKTEKVTIHEQYEADLQFSGVSIVSYTTFLHVWDNHFPHCKIRAFKAVSGKCTFCALLTDLRKNSQNRQFRQSITDMHALHRITYMGERMVYYRKIMKCLNEPKEYMSIIFDGMAQNHTDLPYVANQKDWGEKKLRMHLQGVLEHHQQFVSLILLFQFMANSLTRLCIGVSLMSEKTQILPFILCCFSWKRELSVQADSRRLSLFRSTVFVWTGRNPSFGNLCLLVVLR
jgi:hypothetical protein